MNAKAVLIALVLLGAGGAVYQVSGDAPALEQLLTVPADFNSLGYLDIETIVLGPDPAEACEPGRTTVVAFVSDSCPGCVKLLGHARLLTKRRPDVAVRFVDLGSQWGGQNYLSKYGVNIRSVPHVMLYSGQGKLLAGDDGQSKAGLDLLYKWMNIELNRTDQERYASAR